MKRAFIVAVALAAFLLSFARLVVKVLESGAFTDLEHLLPAALAGPLVIVAACLWALVVDSVWIVGLFGVRQNRRDWRAWAMLSAYALLSVGIQAIGITRELAWGLPPAALVLALVILDLDQRPAAPPAPEPAPDSGRQRLALLDTEDPDRTAELLPINGTPRVEFHNHVHNQTAVRADSTAGASTDAASGADQTLPGAAAGSAVSAATAGTSTRALVTQTWQRLEVEGGQRLSAVALARELTAQRGQRVPEGTVRAELTRLRAHQQRS